MRSTVIMRDVAGIVLLALLTIPALAQPRALEAGRHYTQIEPPLATEAGADRIEVLDVFWYGCPVCAEFEPMMTYWGGEIRGDLVLRRMPAVWNDIMRQHARIYFTALELKLAPQVHGLVFQSIHERQQPLGTVDEVRTLFQTLGVEKEAFDAAWQAPQVDTAVARAEQETRAAGIDRVPALIVNGRYQVVRNQHLQTLPELIIATNELIKGQRDLRRPD